MTEKSNILSMRSKTRVRNKEKSRIQNAKKKKKNGRGGEKLHIFRATTKHIAIVQRPHHSSV